MLLQLLGSSNRFDTLTHGIHYFILSIKIIYIIKYILFESVLLSKNILYINMIIIM